jgi:hypothetical protein
VNITRRLAGALFGTSVHKNRLDIADMLEPFVENMLKEAWSQGHTAGYGDAHREMDVRHDNFRELREDEYTPNPYARPGVAAPVQSNPELWQ